MSFYVLLYFLKEGDPVQMLGFNRYLNAQAKYNELHTQGYTCKIIDTSLLQ